MNLLDIATNSYLLRAHTVQHIGARPSLNTVVFELPSYEIVERDGYYTDKEIQEFKETVEKGAHLFFKYAREGGLKFA